MEDWPKPRQELLDSFNYKLREWLKRQRDYEKCDKIEVIHTTDGQTNRGGVKLNLTEQLAGIAEKLGQLDTNNRGDLAEISRLTTMQNELLAQQALEVKVQVQEQEIESIALPEGYDFDEISGVENMNLMIIEVVKDFQRQYNAKRNAEEQVMITAHRDELRASADRELQLKRQNDELQANNERVKQENDNLIYENVKFRDHIEHISLEREDALSKRDAAVAKAEGLELLVSEKQAQIDTLREEIAIGAKAAINVTRIETTDRLASLVEASKQAKVKSALDIALENTTPFRGKVGVVAELQTPQVEPFQPIDQASDSGFQLVTGPVRNDIEVDQVIAQMRLTPSEGEVQAVQSGLVESHAGENGQTLEEAFRRIEALESAFSGLNFQR